MLTSGPNGATNPGMNAAPSGASGGQGGSGGPGCNGKNCASYGSNGGGGYISVTWETLVIEASTGNCSASSTSFSVPSTGTWTLSVGGGGGAAGLATPPSGSSLTSVNGLGGPGALVTLKVPLTAGQGLEAVVGCDGFSDIGGQGFTNGGYGNDGGGGGGSSALCLEGQGASTCSHTTSNFCTSSNTPPGQGSWCVLAIAGGGGGGGSGSDGPACISPGWTGGDGGDLASPVSASGGYGVSGGNDGAGDFGASASSPNSWTDWPQPYAGFEVSGSGGGGGGYAGGAATNAWLSTSSSDCGGGGGSSWYSSVAHLVGIVQNTCTVAGALSTDCPGVVTVTSVPGASVSRIASRPEAPGVTVW